MELRSTVIKHKRYSVLGWNDRNSDGTLKNTLNQGEIGVLLGPDLQSVLEVRIGIRDNSAFSEGILLGNIDSENVCIKQFPVFANFPSIGSERIIYIDKYKNIPYRWDDTDMVYHPLGASPGEGDGWWEEINGGVADIMIGSLGTSSPID